MRQNSIVFAVDNEILELAQQILDVFKVRSTKVGFGHWNSGWVTRIWTLQISTKGP